MLNKVMIIGRLGRDPELRYTQSGSPICNLNIATDESYTDRDGNKVDRAEWHRVVVFQRAAENCGKDKKRKGKFKIAFYPFELACNKAYQKPR